ncbi:MAG: hypothetical protein ACI89U_003162 [Gammaproteobacteria bacterium]|jgi:uncharacterized protein YifE (UPF0438 family)
MEKHTNFRKLPRYYDDVNYPRGFSKHGDYTITEADTLHVYGRILSELASGKTLPETADEKRFTKVCSGEAKAKTYIENLWVKYLDNSSTKYSQKSLYS